MKKLLLTTAVALFSLGGYAANVGDALIYEDFSKFTAGTQEKADETCIGICDADQEGRGEIDNYTLTSGWTAYGLYQAGGTAVLKGVEMYGTTYSNFNSPSVAMEGNVRIRVKARLYPESTTPTDMRILLMSKSYQYSDMVTVSVTYEWQEFTLDTKVNSNDWMLRLDVGDEEGNVSPVQFSLIEVTPQAASTEKPAAPHAQAASRITDTSFTARWERVQSVSDYKVYVTYQENGQTRQFGEPIKVSLESAWDNTAAKVEDLDPDIIYSYYVTALNGDLESDPSNIVEVLALSTPEVEMASDVTANSFKASWGKVHKASAYEVNLYRLTSAGREMVKTVNATDNFYEFKDIDPSDSNYWAYEVTATLEHNGETLKSDMSDIRGVLLNPENQYFKEMISEDFSKFAKGSADNIYYRPQDDTQSEDSWGEYVNDFKSREIPDEYTTLPGWSGMGVAEAGGMAAISYKPYPTTYQGGYITTPEVGGNAIVRIKFRAASIPQYFTVTDEDPMLLPVKLVSDTYEEFDTEIMGSSMPLTTLIEKGNSGTYIDHYYEVRDADWHDYELILMSHATEPVRFNIGGNSSLSTPFFIDDVKVEVALTYLDAPKGWEADNFTKNGFTAYWSEVPEAESYLLSVFRRKAGKEDYAIVDREFTATEGTVDGLDPNSDYFFTVKAKLGSVVSEASEPVAAIGISTPVALEPTECNADGFTANWERTPKATRYDLMVYRMEGETPVEIQKVEIEEGEAVSYKVEGLEKESVRDFGYALKAYYDTTSTTYESQVSPVYAFNLDTLGVDGVADAQCSVKAQNSAIHIEGAAGTEVTVTDIAGRVIYNGAITSGNLVLTPATGSLYIVKTGAKIHKIIL